MKSICQIVDEARATPGCVVEAPCGIPELPVGAVLPEDVKEFYLRCGGLDMFPDEDWGWRILKPGEVQRADAVLFEIAYETDPSQFDGTASENLFMIAVRGCGPDYISLDTRPQKSGRCYDAFHDVHATASSRIVALSFTELINKLFAWREAGYFWEKSFHGAFS